MEFNCRFGLWTEAILEIQLSLNVGFSLFSIEQKKLEFFRKNIDMFRYFCSPQTNVFPESKSFLELSSNYFYRSDKNFQFLDWTHIRSKFSKHIKCFTRIWEHGRRIFATISWSIIVKIRLKTVENFRNLSWENLTLRY